MTNNNNKLIELLEQSLLGEYPISPFELIKDSQTKLVLEVISKINKEKIKILDYGCGRLRLFNAISNGTFHNKSIEYFGTDIITPKNPKNKKMKYRFIPIEKIKKSHNNDFDIIIVMNVIHELEILEIAELNANIRRLLKNTGSLFIVDMAILPIGENKALPFYSWELEELFINSKDFSYKSKSGIPVTALLIEKKNILVYSEFLDQLINLVQYKNSYYSALASNINDNQKENIKPILDFMSLIDGDVYNKGYLMLMAGYASNRIYEYNKQKNISLTIDKIEKTAEIIIRYIKCFYRKMDDLPCYYDIYDDLGKNINYLLLNKATNMMSNDIKSFFLKIPNDNIGNIILQPSETFDMFEDYYKYADIKIEGLIRIQEICYNMARPY